MVLEGEGKTNEALSLFRQAWDEAADDFEKFTAAHYVARHQASIADKLMWDETALTHALDVGHDGIQGVYPSLYLNIAKGYEDLNNLEKAREYYESALHFAESFSDSGYEKMIKSGILSGLERIKKHGLSE